MCGGRLWPRSGGEAVPRSLVLGREVDLRAACRAQVLGEEVVDREALNLVRSHEAAVDLVELVTEEGVREGEGPVPAELLGRRASILGEDRGRDAVLARDARLGGEDDLALLHLELDLPKGVGDRLLGRLALVETALHRHPRIGRAWAHDDETRQHGPDEQLPYRLARHTPATLPPSKLPRQWPPILTAASVGSSPGTSSHTWSSRMRARSPFSTTGPSFPGTRCSSRAITSRRWLTCPTSSSGRSSRAPACSRWPCRRRCGSPGRSWR